MVKTLTQLKYRYQFPEDRLKAIWIKCFNDKPFPNVKAYLLSIRSFRRILTELNKHTIHTAIYEYNRNPDIKEVNGFLLTSKCLHYSTIIVKDLNKKDIQVVKQKLDIFKKPYRNTKDIREYGFNYTLVHELRHLYNGDILKWKA